MTLIVVVIQVDLMEKIAVVNILVVEVRCNCDLGLLVVILIIAHRWRVHQS